ncbi:MAG: sulfotransferase [Gammaproteobacteria bacterium]|nr:sulfotransferase [Gammaproteobacteria bacterium]MBV8307738.1 sulfotransferase [Gammaproteobacteria bacterium]
MAKAYLGPRPPLVAGAARRALRADELLEAALRRRGRRDFADRSFMGGFEQLLTACNEEADLSVLGVHALRIDLLRCLRNLLHFDEIEATRPAVLARPIRAPVFITGMPRSGTTFLHRLILQDPDTIAPRLFQLVYPGASQGSGLARALRRRWVSLQLALFRMLAPELNALHPVAVDAPEECTDIIAQVFQSLRFDAMYRVPSYNSWLGRSGFLDAYRFHRRFLQHLDAELPGKRWVLKSPDHVFALDDIRKVYPDAHVVLVHRDPVRVLASVAKLTEVLRRPFARSVDRMGIGREVSASWIDGAERMRRLASSSAVLHLNYRQVIARPLDAVAAVYAHCGMVLTAEAERRMRSSLRTAANVRRPWRDYKLAEFGLEAQVLRERFDRYIDTFAIETEHPGRPAGTGAPA